MLPEDARDRRRAQELDVRAQVVHALAAPFAPAAVDGGLDVDTGSNGQTPDARAQLKDDARGLVADGHGLGDHLAADGAIGVVDDVRAADAHRLHAQAHLALAGGLVRPFAEAYVPLAVNQCCAHGTPLV